MLAPGSERSVLRYLLAIYLDGDKEGARDLGLGARVDRGTRLFINWVADIVEI